MRARRQKGENAHAGKAGGSVRCTGRRQLGGSDADSDSVGPYGEVLPAFLDDALSPLDGYVTAHGMAQRLSRGRKRRGEQ